MSRTIDLDGLAAPPPALACVGEVMLELVGSDPLGDLPPLQLGPAGDTFNVAAVAAWLGTASAFVGVVGDDSVGEAVLAGAERTGVDTRDLRRVPGRTALYLVSTDASGERSFGYYREGSAGATLDATMVVSSSVATARAVHTSGITLCLSPSSREAGLAALRLAAERGGTASFDVNFRPDLVEREQARRDLEEAAPLTTLLAVSQADARLLAGPSVGDEDPRRVVEWAWSLGACDVLVGAGLHGAVLGLGSTRDVLTAPAVPCIPVDTTAAGDALVAAYLHASLRGDDPASALRLACRVAGRGVTGRGALGAFSPAHPELGRLLPTLPG